jgi:hypothetical protein
VTEWRWLECAVCSALWICAASSLTFSTESSFRVLSQPHYWMTRPAATNHKHHLASVCCNSTHDLLWFLSR